MIDGRGLRRLAAAAVLSAAAHAALLGGGWRALPQPRAGAPSLSAHLQPRTGDPRPAPPRAAAAPAAAPAAGAPAARPDPAAAAPAAEQTRAEPEEVTAADATIPAPVQAPAAARLPDFPRKGQITYQLSMGSEYAPVGRTVQTWEFDAAQYRLSSRSESTGLVEMIRPHRYIHQSEGRLTEAGLQPERFTASVRRGSRSEESLAVFDWQARHARLGRLPMQSTVSLPAGSQDVVSLIYQFVLFPPQPGRITLPFTRGTRIEAASFDVLPVETIDTPLGRLRVTPVIQARERGAESLAMWLAADYRNLPVRIHFFNRDGEFSGEQLATEIRVAEQ